MYNIIYSALLEISPSKKKGTAKENSQTFAHLCPDLRIGMGLDFWGVFLSGRGTVGDLGKKPPINNTGWLPFGK